MNNRYDLILIAAALSACNQVKSDNDIVVPSPSTKDSSVSFITKDIRKQEILISNLNRCPAESSPLQQISIPQNYNNKLSNCKTDQLGCYQSCLDNDGFACYFSALSLEEAKYTIPAQQLFQRSCELGVASGCTNRAAGMLYFTELLTAKQKDCIFSTFEKTCDWKDPWGCTMYADQLVSMEKPNYNKALDVLNYSCEYGIDDPACQSAKNLQKFINGKIKVQK